MSPSRELLITIAADAYLKAKEAFDAIGTGPDRPEAAKRLAETWLKFTREVAAWRMNHR